MLAVISLKSTLRLSDRSDRSTSVWREAVVVSVTITMATVV